jgi:hypothetical protein
MTSSRPIPLVTVALALLSGCAAGGSPAASSSTTSAPERDCSFRSATTCWTLAPRVPEPGAEPRETVPDSFPMQPPPVLASRADSA